MTKKELIKALDKLSDDTEIVIAPEPHAAGFSRVDGVKFHRVVRNTMSHPVNGDFLPAEECNRNISFGVVEIW